MLTLQQVLDIVNGDKRHIPKEYQNRLKRWRDVYYGMSVHTTGAAPRFYPVLPDGIAHTWFEPANYFGEAYQTLFDNILLSRHPREPKEIRNYRYSQYRPIQQSAFIEAIDVITGAIFQDSNYTIEIANKADSEYIFGNNFENKDLVGYLVSHFQNIIEDPNALFVVLPKQPGHNMTTTDVQPHPIFVPSRFIHYPFDGEDIVFESDGIMWHVNSIGIWRYVKGDSDQYTMHEDDFAAGGYYYAHMFGKCPVVFAGGKKNTQGFLESWFVKAKPIADDLVAGKSAEQLVDKEASHPFIVSAMEDCPSCDSRSGYVQGDCGCGKDPSCESCAGSGMRRYRCDTCGGSGRISRNPGQWIIAPAEKMDKPLIAIVNPDVDINKLHYDKNAAMFKLLKEALYLYRSDKAESGEAKAIDQETKYQFYTRVSNDLFDRWLTDVISYIIGYRHVKMNAGVLQPDLSGVKIVKPTQFQIKTSQDLLDEYKTATEAKVGTFLLNKLLEDFTDKQFGGDAIMKRKSLLITQLDALATTPIADKQLMVSSGAITIDEWRYSTQLPKILDTIIRNNGVESFLNMSYDEVEAQSKEIFSEIPKSQPTATNTINDNRTVV